LILLFFPECNLAMEIIPRKSNFGIPQYDLPCYNYPERVMVNNLKKEIG
jgi:hypothetical protein